MKRIIPIILVIALLLSMTIPVNASTYNDFLGIDESKYDMDAYYTDLWNNYKNNMYGILWDSTCGEEYYLYTQVVNTVGYDGWYEFASWITDEKLTQERYTEILINLMAIMDYNTSDFIGRQVEADTTKTLEDYVTDVTGILVETISLDTAFGSKVTEPMERISTTLNLIWGGAEFAISTVETFAYFDKLIYQYNNYNAFLTAIIENATDSTLRAAAVDLLAVADKAFYYKVEAVTKASEDLSAYLGQTVFFDTILLDHMLADASILKLSKTQMSAVNYFKSGYGALGALQLGADLGTFAGDMLIGISDLMNRYNEMRALVGIRKALITQMTRIRNNISSAKELGEIDTLCKLMKNLIYINFRGEYCAHEMLVHDAQFYSLVIKINGEKQSFDRIYENAKEQTKVATNCIDLNFPSLDFYKISTNLDAPSQPIQNLELTLNDDGKGYSVTGIGTCTDVNIVIPNAHNGLPVTAIGKGAFSSCDSLISITIPNSVSTIGNGAFNFCSNLKSINIPDGVTTIGDAAFAGCAALTNIAIPYGVTGIGLITFSGCSSLTNITIPSSVTSIGYGAFLNCTSLTRISIPSSVTTIGERAFEACSNLERITIPDSVKTIGDSAFSHCESLTGIVIPNGVTKIGTNTFWHCYSLTSIAIPNSVRTIGRGAFSSCYSLTGIVIPNSVTSIGSSAFFSCKSLTSIAIPSSVTKVDSSIFSSCKSLTSITIPSSVTSIWSHAFSHCESLTSITYAGTVEQWENIYLVSDWNEYLPATEVICSNGKISLAES